MDFILNLIQSCFLISKFRTDLCMLQSGFLITRPFIKTVLSLSSLPQNTCQNGLVTEATLNRTALKSCIAVGPRLGPVSVSHELSVVGELRHKYRQQWIPETWPVDSDFESWVFTHLFKAISSKKLVHDIQPNQLLTLPCITPLFRMRLKNTPLHVHDLPTRPDAYHTQFTFKTCAGPKPCPSCMCEHTGVRFDCLEHVGHVQLLPLSVTIPQCDTDKHLLAYKHQKSQINQDKVCCALRQGTACRTSSMALNISGTRLGHGATLPCSNNLLEHWIWVRFLELFVHLLCCLSNPLRILVHAPWQ